MRRILVGLDDSEYSRAAVLLGIEWAKAHNAMLFGLGIIDTPQLTEPEAVPLGGAAFKVQRDEEAVHSARRIVEGLLESFTLDCTRSGVASKLLEEEGDPAEQIVEEAQRVDLILLGQRTNFDLRGAALTNEVLPDVIRRSPRPVVTVPKSFVSRPAARKSVVVAYDGSVQSARALQVFVGLGLARDSTVHVLSVAAQKIDAARRADRASDYLSSHEIPATAHAIAGNNPAAEILTYIQSMQADLLVLGAYGQPTFKEFFFGSVTRTVLDQSPIPTLLYS